MKKIIALILAGLILVFAVACGNTDNNNNDDVNNNDDPAPSDKELSANASVEELAKKLMQKYAEYIDFEGQYNKMIAGAQATFELYKQYSELTADEFDAFLVEMENDSSLQEEFSYYASLGYEEFVSELTQMAAVFEEQAQISYDEYFSECMNVSEVPADAEYLVALTQKPAGYTEAYLYQPGMMGQAFIGYVFRVEEGTDIEQFKKSLLDNSDSRWHICTEANTKVCESFGDLVYFSMMVVENADTEGFTVEQKDGLYNTFIETIKGSAK